MMEQGDKGDHVHDSVGVPAARGRKECEFERVYGSNGVWPAFFAMGDGYLGTELLKDPDRPGRYMTIDRWDSRERFEAFRNEHRAEYTRIDNQCEALTEHETHIGSFVSLGAE